MDTIIDVPPGIDDDQRMRIPRKGDDASGGGGMSGDLNVHIRVAQTTSHEKQFQRNGINLSIEVPITYRQAILGTTISVPTVDGHIQLLKIPSGSQPNSMLTITGKGVPKLNRAGSRGDLHVILKVKIPKFDDLQPEEKKFFDPKSSDFVKSSHSVDGTPFTPTPPSDQTNELNEKKSLFRKLKDSLCESTGSK